MSLQSSLQDIFQYLGINSKSHPFTEYKRKHYLGYHLHSCYSILQSDQSLDLSKLLTDPDYSQILNITYILIPYFFNKLFTILHSQNVKEQFDLFKNKFKLFQGISKYILEHLPEQSIKDLYRKKFAFLLITLFNFVKIIDTFSDKIKEFDSEEFLKFAIKTLFENHGDILLLLNHFQLIFNHFDIKFNIHLFIIIISNSIKNILNKISQVLTHKSIDRLKRILHFDIIIIKIQEIINNIIFSIKKTLKEILYKLNYRNFTNLSLIQLEEINELLNVFKSFFDILNSSDREEQNIQLQFLNDLKRQLIIDEKESICDDMIKIESLYNLFKMFYQRYREPFQNQLGYITCASQFMKTQQIATVVDPIVASQFSNFLDERKTSLQQERRKREFELAKRLKKEKEKELLEFILRCKHYSSSTKKKSFTTNPDNFVIEHPDLLPIYLKRISDIIFFRNSNLSLIIIDTFNMIQSLVSELLSAKPSILKYMTQESEQLIRWWSSNIENYIKLIKLYLFLLDIINLIESNIYIHYYNGLKSLLNDLRNNYSKITLEFKLNLVKKIYGYTVSDIVISLIPYLGYLINKVETNERELLVLEDIEKFKEMYESFNKPIRII
jgi:hypothetical protein